MTMNGLRRGARSDHDPLKDLRIETRPSAVPSIIPTTSGIPPSGVVGCGLMGSGIAQVATQSGYDTVVVEVEQKFLDKGLAGIDKSLGKFVEKGKMSAADKDSCLNRLKGSTSLKDLAECD